MDDLDRLARDLLNTPDVEQAANLIAALVGAEVDDPDADLLTEIETAAVEAIRTVRADAEPVRQSRHGTVWTPIRSDARYVVATRPGGRQRTFARDVWERMTILLDLHERYPLGVDLGDP